MTRAENPPQEPIRRWGLPVTSIKTPRFDPNSPHWVRQNERISPSVGYWAFKLTRSLGGTSVYDPKEEALWFYIGDGFGKEEIEWVKSSAHKEVKAWRRMTGSPVSPKGADYEFRRQSMRVNPPMLVLGNPGVNQDDANAIKGYVASMRGQSVSRVKSSLRSKLQGHVSKKQLREFLKYAVKVKRMQDSHHKQLASERPYDLFEGPADTGLRRKNIAPFALMVVGEKTGKVYAMDTSAGAMFTSGGDFKTIAHEFANSVRTNEPLLVVKTSKPPYDPAELSPGQDISVEPKWAKKFAVYRVKRDRNPSWHEGMPIRPARRYTPKLPTERPATFDEAVSLGKKTGWVMVHGGDPDPRKMESLVKKLRDAKFSTDQGSDGSLWVYIGIESYFLGGPRKWKDDVNWAMKVLGLRPAFRDTNPHLHECAMGSIVDAYPDEKLYSREIRVHSRHDEPGCWPPSKKGMDLYYKSPKTRRPNPNLGDLIPASAVSAVTRALKKHGTGPALHRELVAILEPHRAELEGKGVLVEYLAYAIEAAAGRQGNSGSNGKEGGDDPWAGKPDDEMVALRTTKYYKKMNDYTAVAWAEGFEEPPSEIAMLSAWQYISDKGLWRSLQGFFGRTVRDLLDRGIIEPPQKNDGLDRSVNPFDAPAEEFEEPDPEFWTGFETSDDAEADELLDMAIQAGYKATKKGEPGKWIVWVYNHGLRSEKKKIERLAESKFEFRSKKLAERRAAEDEEAARMSEFQQQRNAEKIAEILRKQPSGRKPGELWALVRTYGPGYEQTGTNEEWEAWGREFESDRSCLEANGIEVAWTRNRSHGYFLWAWIGTESEILTSQDVQDVFDRRREGVVAALRAYCRGDKIETGPGWRGEPGLSRPEQYREQVRKHKEAKAQSDAEEAEPPTEPINRWMGRQQNPATTARQKNWQPHYWHSGWNELVRRANDAIHDAIYGPYRQEEHEKYAGLPKWSEKPTEHPTEWDKRAVRAIVDARNYLRAKSPERRHLGDTLKNIITYITRDFLIKKKRKQTYDTSNSNLRNTFNDWARRTLKYAESYFLKSRPDPEFVGPIPKEHPWQAFEAAKSRHGRGARYSPSAGEMYRKIDWAKLIADNFKGPEDFIQKYEEDLSATVTILIQKAFPSYYYGRETYVKEGKDWEMDSDAWKESIDKHTPQTERSFAVALERVKDAIETGDITIGEGK